MLFLCTYVVAAATTASMHAFYNIDGYLLQRFDQPTPIRIPHKAGRMLMGHATWYLFKGEYRNISNYADNELMETAIDVTTYEIRTRRYTVHCVPRNRHIIRTSVHSTAYEDGIAGFIALEVDNRGIITIDFRHNGDTCVIGVAVEHRFDSYAGSFQAVWNPVYKYVHRMYTASDNKFLLIDMDNKFEHIIQTNIYNPRIAICGGELTLFGTHTWYRFNSAGVCITRNTDTYIRNLQKCGSMVMYYRCDDSTGSTEHIELLDLRTDDVYCIGDVDRNVSERLLIQII